ncbi:hypothetical protein M9H77_02023 [Catharanthus roseus]|uniref:Uncharacterized protein n=1 Tax=Catharanthus roseus TaxID=4058 RepID=A0ACC0C7A1_CATRO|nr:hypothetical protein M9H77_02023 [Catharanthus roseus]
MVLRFNGVEDFKGFKIKMLILKGSLEELKGFNCAVYKKSLHWFSLEEFKGFNFTVCKENFGKFIRRTGKTSKLKGGSRLTNRDRKGQKKFESEGSTMKRKFDTGQKRKDIKCRECEGYGHIQAKCAHTLKKNRSMNTILSDDKKRLIDFEDTSMHNYHKDDSDDNFIYSDEEISYEELQDTYSLLYTKWIGLVKLHHDLKNSLKKNQEQKDALEERNYKLIAQAKDATERVYMAEDKIARLNTVKAKLDEIISVGRPDKMKSGLGYTAYPVHHFIDELSPIVTIPFLSIESSINQSMEDIDEGIKEGSEGKHNAEGKTSSASNLEVVKVTSGTGLS